MDSSVHQSVFTPSTYFTIACVAFSVVALTSIWRTSAASAAMRLPKSPERPRPRRRVGVDSMYLKAPPPDPSPSTINDDISGSALVVLAQLISLFARQSDQIRDASRDDSQAANLLVELSTMTTTLCRLQQCVCSNDYNGNSNVDNIAPGTGAGACFTAVTSGLQATLRLLQSSSDDMQTQMQRGEVCRQLQAQRPALEFLISTLSPILMPPTPPAELVSEARFQFGDEAGMSTGSLTPMQTPLGITPAMDAKGWIEPPPEYSPPSSSACLPLAEKSSNEKIVTDTPMMHPPEVHDTIEASDDALYQAVTVDDQYGLAELLTSGMDPNEAIGELQRTPLHQAAHLNHCACLSILLRHGAVMSTEDSTGDTALHLAAWAGNVEALSSLLAHGADVDWLSGRDGYSPLWCAITASHIDAARLLLRQGARVSLRSASGGGMMPLHQAAVMGQSAMCELLLERGALVSAIDEQLNTPLHYAAASGSASSVHVLLRQGADVEAQQSQGLTAAHWAAHKGHVDVLTLLLEYGAPFDCEAEEGATPLHLAANRGHLPVVRLLLEKGADKNAVAAGWDGTNGTPAQMAKAKGHSRVAKILRTWGKE